MSLLLILVGLAVVYFSTRVLSRRAWWPFNLPGERFCAQCWTPATDSVICANCSTDLRETGAISDEQRFIQSPHYTWIFLWIGISAAGYYAARLYVTPSFATHVGSLEYRTRTPIEEGVSLEIIAHGHWVDCFDDEIRSLEDVGFDEVELHWEGGSQLRSHERAPPSLRIKIQVSTLQYVILNAPDDAAQPRTISRKRLRQILEDAEITVAELSAHCDAVMRSVRQASAGFYDAFHVTFSPHYGERLIGPVTMKGQSSAPWVSADVFNIVGLVGSFLIFGHHEAMRRWRTRSRE
jgi:hypothetical protein